LLFSSSTNFNMIGRKSTNRSFIKVMLIGGNLTNRKQSEDLEWGKG
jgi:hypothetical protein